MSSCLRRLPEVHPQCSRQHAAYTGVANDSSPDLVAAALHRRCRGALSDVRLCLGLDLAPIDCPEAFVQKAQGWCGSSDLELPPGAAVRTGWDRGRETGACRWLVGTRRRL